MGPRIGTALASTLAALAGVVAGCGGGDSSDTAQISIRTFMFDPDPVEIEAGTTVEWTNEDEILHTVTAGRRGDPTGDFDHRLEDVGATARVTLSEPGRFEYFCSIHDGMDGRAIVH